MADVTFIQRSRIGRSIFLLRGETLDVTGSFFGISSARQVSLRSLSSDYELVAQRVWLLVLVPLILTAIVAAAAYGLAAELRSSARGNVTYYMTFVRPCISARMRAQRGRTGHGVCAWVWPCGTIVQKGTRESRR